MSVGGKIREARKEAGMTQGELAEKLGVYAKDICRWETEERMPSLQKFKELCMCLKVSADQLLDL
ncbi:MAG: helix-turn-helix domain-containing protein [Lachnospiraceae bacterium]